MKRKFLGLALCSAVLAFSGIAYAEEALQVAVSGEHRAAEN